VTAFLTGLATGMCLIAVGEYAYVAYAVRNRTRGAQTDDTKLGSG